LNTSTKRANFATVKEYLAIKALLEKKGLMKSYSAKNLSPDEVTRELAVTHLLII
jgi:CRISPR/Cas system Type II protein with McrA/HNH and RuvC-like nuclease domain